MPLRRIAIGLALAAMTYSAVPMLRLPTLLLRAAAVAASALLTSSVAGIRRERTVQRSRLATAKRSAFLRPINPSLSDSPVPDFGNGADTPSFRAFDCDCRLSEI